MAVQSLKIKLFFASFILLFQVVEAQNDTQSSLDLPRNHLYSSYTGLNADANIFNDISLSSFELLSTNIQFSKDDDLQKVVFAPLQLRNIGANESYLNSFFRNTKLNLAQKNNISTVGIGFTWDNSMHNTKRGRRISREMINLNASKFNKKINTDFAEIIEKDLKAIEESKSVYKLSDKMIKFIKSIFNLLKSQPDVGFLPAMSISDFGERGFTYQDYSYYSELYKKYSAKSSKLFNQEVVLKYYKALQENSVKITFGGNLSLFSILGSDEVDLDNDDLNDNEYSLQQRNLSLGFTHIVNECLGYSLTGYYLEKRASAEAENNLEPYFGFSAAIGIRTLILDKNYKTSKDYLESLFVPSVHTGISFEYLDCNAAEDGNCVNGILRSNSLTPYIEFKINPKNQFRIGIPISQNNRLDSENAEIGPFIQWRLQLSGKN